MCELTKPDSASGYNRHLYYNSSPCTPCMEEKRKYQQAHRRNQDKPDGDKVLTRRQLKKMSMKAPIKRVYCGTLSGSNYHYKAGESSCEECNKVRRTYNREYYYIERQSNIVETSSVEELQSVGCSIPASAKQNSNQIFIDWLERANHE